MADPVPRRVERHWQRAGDTERHSEARPTLAVSMIVRDEQAFLEDCLRSVLPIADEIIVVDTGSSDATVSIATQLGAKVHQFPWCDDFAIARNHALSLVTAEWVLSIDADERLPEPDARRLRELIALPDSSAYRMRLRCPVSLAAGPQPATLTFPVRLFRAGFGYRFVGRLHEQVVPGNGLAWPPPLCNVEILHVGYLHDDKLLRSTTRNLALFGPALVDDPSDHYLEYDLARTLLWSGRTSDAVALFNRLTALTECPDWLRGLAWWGLSESYQQMGLSSEALSALRQSVRSAPTMQGPRWLLATLLYHLGDFDECDVELERLVSLKRSPAAEPPPSDLCIPEPMITALRGLCATRSGVERDRLLREAQKGQQHITPWSRSWLLPHMSPHPRGPTPT